MDQPQSIQDTLWCNILVRQSGGRGGSDRTFFGAGGRAISWFGSKDYTGASIWLCWCLTLCSVMSQRIRGVSSICCAVIVLYQEAGRDCSGLVVVDAVCNHLFPSEHISENERWQGA